MAVNTPTEHYQRLLPIWNKIRIASAGQDAVKLKQNQKMFLPCPIGYDESWYGGVLHRAYWFGATGTTVESYQGAIYRKQPTIQPEPTKSQLEYIEEVDTKGNDLNTFSTIVTNDIIKTSYGGILVDFDDTGGELLTEEQATKKGLRARCVYYPAESIFNAGKNHVRLKETYKDIIDEFTVEVKEQIKVLDIFEGKYRQRIFREVDDESEEYIQYGDDIFPTLPGKAEFKYIPFQFIGSTNNDFEPDDPMLLDLVNANFQHYGLYSDFREALHWLRPFLYRTGYNQPEDQSEQVISSNVMLSSKSPDTKFGILEFTGSGLQWDVRALELIESQMAAMGGDILRSKKKSAESADKARIDKSSETSILATMANNISAAITKSINIMLEWNGQAGNLTYQLNTDYDPSLFDAQLMTAINKSVEMRNMSRKTAVSNFKRGELLPDGYSVEDEIDQIEAEQSKIGNMDELTEIIFNVVESMKQEDSN